MSENNLKKANEKPKVNKRAQGIRLMQDSNAAISIIGAFALLIMINYLSIRHYARLDWTASGLYTLSDKTKKSISTLNNKVELNVMWSQGDERFIDAKELLQRYAALSPNIKLKIFDPDLNREGVKMLIDRYGAKISTIGEGYTAIEASVIVVSGENVKFVPASDFEDFGPGMMGPGGNEGISGYKAEQALTSAILHVTSKNQQKICFTGGHGEWGFTGYGARTLGHAKEGLIQDGYKVQAISTLGVKKIPDDCELVLVAGPQKSFLPQEVKLVTDYVNFGGRLLLLLDPMTENTKFIPTGFESFLRENGLKIANDIILETKMSLLVSTSPLTFMVNKFTNHKAVKILQGPPDINALPVIFTSVRSMEQIKDFDGQAIVDVLAQTSASSWGEVSLESFVSVESPPAMDQYDNKGPLVVAAAVTISKGADKKDGGRIIVAGDSDFLSEELFINSGLYNRDFFTSVTGWLTEKESLISIAPKNPEHISMNLTRQDVSRIWKYIIGEVLLIIILGVFVWMRRRK